VKFRLSAVAVLIVASLVLSPAWAGDYRIYLTRGNSDDQPGTEEQASFHCSDTIMAVLTGDWPAGTGHTFDVYWTNPRGRQQEHSRQKFTSYGTTRVWVWLRLHPGERSLLDKILMEEDTSMQEFVGQWKVDFYLDGRKLARQRFSVAC